MSPTVGKHLCNFPGEIYSTPSEVSSVAGYWYRVTLEVLLRFFVRQHVDLCVARATQIDGTAFDTIARKIFSLSLSQFVEAQKREKKWRKVMATQAEDFANGLKYIRLIHSLAIS
jgi:hypothetical protein